MLSEEVTIGIYPNGELNDVLIVPDGHEYHLFSTDTNVEYGALKKTIDLGSIVFINNDWVYEGSGLSAESQQEIADYIFNYINNEPNQSSLM